MPGKLGRTWRRQLTKTVHLPPPEHWHTADTAKSYHWVEGLLFRTRLNTLGDNIEQLFLPNPYHARCLSLAHENFGHAGRKQNVSAHT